MILKSPKYILTDIEGTTSSISFVAEKLFPYFRNNILDLAEMTENPIVKAAFEQTIQLAKSEDGETISTDQEIIDKLYEWSVEDRKITPLKTLQGVLWEKGYQEGELKGHVYPEVAANLKSWKEQGIELGVFSSGSVSAQKLIFGYSISGDLTPYFSSYFDTNTGGKRESETYKKIAQVLQINPSEILFLSDIVEELEAADSNGFQTIQLSRDGMTPSWKQFVTSFDEITFE
ncbi:acireductone synthase [Fluviicola taffensis]|uniref:Enolase-phosphatase E1 n=1 Tax=Fluviicola taffensis (strain DSM 16823 / NCIMB 13979 / RW262) TaxID=755732 RepID=F2I9F0_FLUTR|nr:acireductone synthase [Fluviicola taffensis]AEA44107.1 acireductone synthase [Fluviicola taffensis DSM 16823]